MEGRLRNGTKGMEWKRIGGKVRKAFKVEWSRNSLRLAGLQETPGTPWTLRAHDPKREGWAFLPLSGPQGGGPPSGRELTSQALLPLGRSTSCRPKWDSPSVNHLVWGSNRGAQGTLPMRAGRPKCLCSVPPASGLRSGFNNSCSSRGTL